MFHVLLFCSDEGCDALYEAFGPLEELLALACDCGCGLALAGPPDAVEDGAGSLVVLDAA